MNLNRPDLLMKQAFINGQWVDASDGKTFAVDNPANGKVLAEIADIGATQTTEALDAAEKALVNWRQTLATERYALLKRWVQLIRENLDDLAQLLTQEQGKVFAEAQSEIHMGANRMDWCAEEAKRIYGMTVPANNMGSQSVVLKQPIGVVAAISPWNFPIGTSAGKLAPALAAGCTIVLKPSETTPLSVLALVKLAEEAGFPAGVVNVLPSNQAKAVGEVMTTHEAVRKVTFTGSTAVGKLLASQAGANLKKLTLELGGNAPFIVFDDADVDAAVADLRGFKFFNAGQICVCPNRVIVHESVHDEFVAKLKSAMQDIKVGNGMDASTKQGPQNNQKCFDKINKLVNEAVAADATVELGGKPHELGGLFYEPTLLTNLTRDMTLAHDEIFGPVAAVYKFKTEAEAIEFANDTEYGLASYFYSRDIGRVWRVSQALEFGIVASNTVSFGAEAAPFGGMKHSGVGRESGKFSVEEYLEIKHACMGGLQE